MKNQNDLIVIGVCVVFAIGGALTLFFTKREPVALAAPSAVVTAEPKFGDNTAPAWGDSLAGGGGGGAGFAGGFGGAPTGGKMSFGGMSMGGNGGAMGGMGGPGSAMRGAGSPGGIPNKPKLNPRAGG